ncbi:MAG TPA: transposase [Xanthobacteraceae bacterium]|nr:transposase [Xanthobacteraceae bacterium]
MGAAHRSRACPTSAVNSAEIANSRFRLRANQYGEAHSARNGPARVATQAGPPIVASLIAACTAPVVNIHAPPDPRLASLAAHLTWIDQIGEDIKCHKTRLETCRDPRAREFWKQEIARLEKIKRAELAALQKAIRQHRDLAERFDLIASFDGIGPKTAVIILVRIPEIGRLSREQVAALVGLAPYDDDSGDRYGRRRPQARAVWGVRRRAAGILSSQSANTVVARGTAWQPQGAH